MTTILFILLFVQLFFWTYFFSKLSRYQAPERLSKRQEPVSVIIAARNEETNLERHLPTILGQDHPQYQIIVIDDHSTDGTETILRKMENADRKIVSRKSNQNAHGKKQAIKHGIAISDHDVLLMTDADCRPVTNEWISTMTNALEASEVKIVLGYSPYKLKAGFLSLWVHFENWLVGVQYLSYALRAMPYMGVGRNLLYRKSLYHPDMIEKYEHLLSGDDDLTLMQMADGSNTIICIDPNSFVETEAPETLGDYIRQKRRHLTTAPYYKWIHKILLGLFGISQTLFFLSAILCLCNGHWLLTLSIILARLLFVLPIASGCKNKLKAEFSIIQFLFLDIILALHFLFFGILSFIPYKKKW